MKADLMASGYPQPRPGETADERRKRVTQEAALLAEGRAQLDAGQGVELDALEGWLDRLDHDETAPISAPSRFRS